MMRAFFERPAVVIALGQVLQLLVGLFTSTLIARHLNADGYGISNLLRTLVLYIATVLPLGLDVALLKYRSRFASDGEFLATALRLRRVVFIITLVIMAGLLAATDAGLITRLINYPDIGPLLLLAMLVLPFLADIAVLGAVYRALGRITPYALLSVYVPTVFRLIAVPIGVLVWPTVTMAVSLFTAQFMLSWVLLFIDGHHLSRRAMLEAGPNVQRASWDEARLIFSESLWMCMSVAIYGLMRSADIFFLGIYSDAASLGSYSALAMVCQLITVVPLALSQSLGPDVAKAFHAGDRSRIGMIYERYLSKTVLLSGFIFGGIAAFSSRLDLIFGKSFSISPWLSLVLPLGYLVSAVLAPMGFSLSMTGYHRQENSLLWLGAVVLIGLNFLLVPRYGSMGAATSVLLAFVLINVTRYAYVVKIHRLALISWAALPPIMLALLCAYGCLWGANILGARTLLNTVLACTLYTGLFFSLSYAFLMPISLRHWVKTAVGLKPQ